MSYKMNAMLSSNLFVFQRSFQFTVKRYKMFKSWGQTNKKRTSTDLAINHFDDFYGSVFGKTKWEYMKKAMFRRHKYVALVNNFGNDEATCKLLEDLGAHDMKRLFNAQKEFDKNVVKDDTPSKTQQSNHVDKFLKQTEQSEVEELYGNSENSVIPKKIEFGDTILTTEAEEPQVENSPKKEFHPSLTTSLNTAEIDESRIISPGAGMRATELWMYMPTTRLKGCEDRVTESDHLRYYSSANDYPLNIEDEDEFEFPEHLKIYCFESNSKSNFPQPRRDLSGVFNYYLMDGTSILPILALGIKKGDRVLDMCASPGGKSLTILQSLLSKFLLCNDSSLSRVNRIRAVFNEYLHDFNKNIKWEERVQLSNEDGRVLEDEEGFDKVLIDVPCTTDRHSIKTVENNIFRSDRVRERLKIPELQSELLSRALSLCKVGGTVVYSTCTLSPIQNDGVVHMGLKIAWEQYRIKATIKNVTKSMGPAQSLFRLGTGRATPKYGQLIIPDVLSNFGPSYFAKIVKTEGQI